MYVLYVRAFFVCWVVCLFVGLFENPLLQKVMGSLRTFVRKGLHLNPFPCDVLLLPRAGLLLLLASELPKQQIFFYDGWLVGRFVCLFVCFIC